MPSVTCNTNTMNEVKENNEKVTDEALIKRIHHVTQRWRRKTIYFKQSGREKQLEKHTTEKKKS